MRSFARPPQMTWSGLRSGVMSINSPSRSGFAMSDALSIWKSKASRGSCLHHRLLEIGIMNSYSYAKTNQLLVWIYLEGASAPRFPPFFAHATKRRGGRQEDKQMLHLQIASSVSNSWLIILMLEIVGLPRTRPSSWVLGWAGITRLDSSTSDVDRCSTVQHNCFCP